MNDFTTEAAQSENKIDKDRSSEIQELSELQLTLIGGGNVIVTCG